MERPIEAAFLPDTPRGMAINAKKAQRRRSGLAAVLRTGHAEDLIITEEGQISREDFSLLRTPITVKRLLRQLELLLAARRDKDI